MAKRDKEPMKKGQPSGLPAEQNRPKKPGLPRGGLPAEQNRPKKPGLPRGAETLTLGSWCTSPPSLGRARAGERLTDIMRAIRPDSDRIIAFVAPDQTGDTEDTIRRAERAGKPIEVR
jgi:hypothetical protein